MVSVLDFSAEGWSVLLRWVTRKPAVMEVKLNLNLSCPAETLISPPWTVNIKFLK